MLTQRSFAVRQLNPILGFGPIGWMAAVVLASVITLAIAGYDFQWHFIWMIYRVFDGHAAIWFESYVHPAHWFLWDDALFGFISGGLVILALFVAPKRGWWWRCAIVAVWTLVHPPLLLHVHIRALNPSGLLPDPYMRMIVLILLSDLLTSGTLGILMRSRQVLLVCAAASVLVTIIELAIRHTVPPPAGWVYSAVAFNPWTGLGWQFAIGGICLWWAIRRRQRWFEPWRCQACGYDLHGTPASRCPECGQAVDPAADAPQNAVKSASNAGAR